MSDITENKQFKEMSLSDLHTLMQVTSIYLSYYNYNFIYANDKKKFVLGKVKDKFIDENYLKNDFIEKLNDLGIILK